MPPDADFGLSRQAVSFPTHSYSISFYYISAVIVSMIDLAQSYHGVIVLDGRDLSPLVNSEYFAIFILLKLAVLLFLFLMEQLAPSFGRPMSAGFTWVSTLVIATNTFSLYLLMV